jgi:hypothetical protein
LEPIFAFIVFASIWETLGVPFLTFGVQMAAGAIGKHAISKLPNDFIPVITSVIGMGIYKLAGAEVGEAAMAGLSSAMAAKLTHTVGKRAVEKRKATREGFQSWAAWKSAQHYPR